MSPSAVAAFDEYRRFFARLSCVNPIVFYTTLRLDTVCSVGYSLHSTGCGKMAEINRNNFMKDAYQFIKYEPDLKVQLMELQRHQWGLDKAHHSAYFNWKYERNPYISSPIIRIAMHGNKAVGMLGVFGTKWQYGDEAKTAVLPCAADGVVAPEHRKQGLFVELMKLILQDLARDGYTHAVALSASVQSYPGLVKTGWRHIGPMKIMRRKSPAPQTRLVKILRSLKAQGPFHNLDKECSTGAPVTVDSAARPEAMADLVRRLHTDPRIRHVRDAEYFSWRFQNPFSRYRFLFWQKEQLEGYLVLQTGISINTPSATIIDWEATRESVKNDLLQAVIQHGGFLRLNAWSSMLPESDTRTLRETGFQYNKNSAMGRDYPVLIRPTLENAEKKNWFLEERSLIDLCNWDLQLVCSDHCF